MVFILVGKLGTCTTSKPIQPIISPHSSKEALGCRKKKICYILINPIPPIYKNSNRLKTVISVWLLKATSSWWSKHPGFLYTPSSASLLSSWNFQIENALNNCHQKPETLWLRQNRSLRVQSHIQALAPIYETRKWLRLVMVKIKMTSA